MSKTNAGSYVGMDLDASGGNVVEAIIEAIMEDNEGVVVDDFSIFKKIKAPHRLVLNRETVEHHLGRDWNLDEIHLYMSSYFGFIADVDEDHLILHWETV